MLKQLKKPYYYSHDCIFWDFQSARWKYFKEQNQFIQFDNPEALFDDGGESLFKPNNEKPIKLTDQVYKVRIESRMDGIEISLIPKGEYDYSKRLRDGDLFRFENR